MGDEAVADFLTREQENLGDITKDIEDSNNDKSDDLNNFEVVQPFNNDDSQHDSNSISDPQIDESSFISQWRIDFEAKIKEKDEKEMKDKLKLEEKAKKDLAEWNKVHVAEVEARRKANKTENVDTTPPKTKGDSYLEKGKVFTGEAPKTDDVEVWNNVCDLCKFQGRSKVKDTSRMRSILLGLKSTAAS